MPCRTLSSSLVQPDTNRECELRFFFFFSHHLLEEDWEQTFLWESFILLCLSASLCRQGELSLILHNPLCWFPSNTNPVLPGKRVKVPHARLDRDFSSSSLSSSHVLLRTISSPNINSREASQLLVIKQFQ